MKTLLLLIFILFSGASSAETFRLYLIYSDGALEDYGGVGPVDVWYRNQVALATETFQASGVDLEIEIAERVYFRDIAPDLSYPIEAIRNGHDTLQRLMGTRDMISMPIPTGPNPDPDEPYTGLAVDVGADLVVMVSSGRSVAQRQVCGLASQLNDERYLTEPNNLVLFAGLISMSNGISGLCDGDGMYAVLAHEIGHVLGSGHLKGGDANGLYEDAYGAPCNGGETLMGTTADNLNASLEVSDPDKMVNGTQCGDTEHANNKRVFNLIAPQIGQRFTPGEWVYDGELSITADATQINEGETVTITVSRSGTLTNESTVEVIVSPDVGDTDYTHFSGSVDTQSVTFLPDETEKTVSISLADDTSTNADRGFSVFLMNGGRFNVPVDPLNITVADNDQSSGGGNTGGGNTGGGSSGSESSGGGTLGWWILLLLISSRKNTGCQVRKGIY